jgi:hypothetical protein
MAVVEDVLEVQQALAVPDLGDDPAPPIAIGIATEY